jgi:U3 small nucleolar RNA-associated protein 12
MSYSGTFLVSCSKDRSIRIFEQSDEQVFVEEEREQEMERRFLEGVEGSGVDVEVVGGVKVVGVESGIAARATLNTLSVNERLIEALEVSIPLLFFVDHF